jgi:hypothetical protein
MPDGLSSGQLRRPLAFFLYVAISAIPAGAERLPIRSQVPHGP